MPLAESSESRSVAMSSQSISLLRREGKDTSATAGAAGKSSYLQRGQVFLPSWGESQVERHSRPNSWEQGKRTASSVMMPLPVMLVP